MSRLSLVLAASAALLLAACSSGGTTATAGVGSPEPATSASAPAASDAGAGACAPSTDPGTVEAAMSGNAFTPATIAAKVGDVIAWTNGDNAPHTATLRDDPACTTPNLEKGDTGSLTFSAPGTYAYYCKIHADMTGTVEVTS